MSKLKCGVEGCNCGGPMYLHSRCHPTSPTWASVDGDVVTVECAECRKPITHFKVAKEDA